MLASLSGVHFEMTRKCDISSTSLKGKNENLRHLLSGIVLFCKILVICEPLEILLSFEESFKTTSIAHKCKIVVNRGFKLEGYLNLNLKHASMRLVKLSFLSYSGLDLSIHGNTENRGKPSFF